MEETDNGPISVPNLSVVEPAPPQPPGRNCTRCNRPLPVCLCHVIPPSRSLPGPALLSYSIPTSHATRFPPSLSYPDVSSTLPSSSDGASRSSHSSLQSLQPPQTFSLFPPTDDQAATALSSKHPRLDQPPPWERTGTDSVRHHMEAREGDVEASEDCLRKVSAVRVCLDGDYREDVEGGSMYDEEETLVMRKEPREGYVSTMEAVARALGTVEYGGGEVEGSLIGVLREMVGLLRRFLKPMKPRVRMEKKKKKKKKKRWEDDCPAPAD